jgi:hypothetical protein
MNHRYAMEYESLFLISLLLTVVIETIVMLVYFRLTKSTIKPLPILFTAWIASFSTLPYLWFILPVFIWDNTLYVVVSELTAFVLETFIIKGILKTNALHAICCSLACNATSFLLGLLIF